MYWTTVVKFQVLWALLSKMVTIFCWETSKPSKVALNSSCKTSAFENSSFKNAHFFLKGLQEVKGETFYFPDFGALRTRFSSENIFMSFWDIIMIIGANWNWDPPRKSSKVFYPPPLVFYSPFLLGRLMICMF